MDEEQQAICEQVVNAWVDAQNDQPNLPTLIWNTLDARLPALVWQELEKRHPAFLESLADRAIAKWIEDGEVGLPKPTAKVRAKIDAILDDIAGDEFLPPGAVQRQQVKLYKLAENGVNPVDIAKTLRLPLKETKTLIERARVRVENLRRELAAYDGQGANAPSDEPAA